MTHRHVLGASTFRIPNGCRLMPWFTPSSEQAFESRTVHGALRHMPDRRALVSGVMAEVNRYFMIEQCGKSAADL